MMKFQRCEFAGMFKKYQDSCLENIFLFCLGIDLKFPTQSCLRKISRILGNTCLGRS
jgi:hypothetical protein